MGQAGAVIFKCGVVRPSLCIYDWLPPCAPYPVYFTLHLCVIIASHVSCKDPLDRSSYLLPLSPSHHSRYLLPLHTAPTTAALTTVAALVKAATGSGDGNGGRRGKCSWKGSAAAAAARSRRQCSHHWRCSSRGSCSTGGRCPHAARARPAAANQRYCDACGGVQVGTRTSQHLVDAAGGRACRLLHRHRGAAGAWEVGRYGVMGW